MNESDLDRRLRRWLTEREPGPVPASLRVRAGRVPFETPIPISRRVLDVVVGPGGSRRVGGGTRRGAVILVLVGALLVATIASLLSMGSARPSRLPGVERWGAFVVDEPAPPVVMDGLPGLASDADDGELEFEDLVGSVVAVLVPGSRGDDPGARHLASIAEARRLTGEGVVFLVGSRSPSVVDGLTAAGGVDAIRIGVVDLSTGRLETAFPDGADALVVIDRGGVVRAAYAGSLPGPDQLVDLLHRLEAGR
jgi:hypothetical protein